MRGHAGKVAVVTGAARGIGQAYAKRLAEDGVKVAIADMGDTAETEAMVAAAGGEVFGHRCDVGDAASIDAFAAAVVERFGQVDILVNNAGIYPFSPIAEMSLDDWRKVMTIDLDGVFLVTKAFLPGMRERRWGRVVNATSATFGMVVPNATHYVAAKMGVIGFTRALASEVGEEGVTVNAIAPGATRTPGMVAEWGEDIPAIEMAKAAQAIKRGGEPEDLVGAVSFLTSDDAAFITGQTIVVDGGMVRV